ncbi:MAG: GspH/FimT family pseudopilin [Nevskia sp.]|nr:GspH/FimT family pseudopilin [Nevskia sp.]
MSMVVFIWVPICELQYTHIVGTARGTVKLGVFRSVRVQEKCDPCRIGVRHREALLRTAPAAGFQSAKRRLGNMAMQRAALFVRHGFSRARRRPRNRSGSSVQRGWTLAELLVALAVSSILLAEAIPAFDRMLAYNRLAVSANQLLTDLLRARQTAIQHNQAVTFCAGNASVGCHGDWSAREWIVFVDYGHDGRLDREDVLQATGSLADAASLAVMGNGPFERAVIYQPTGMAQTSTGAFAAGSLWICVRNRPAPNATRLVLAASGRVRSESDACPI